MSEEFTTKELLEAIKTNGKLEGKIDYYYAEAMSGKNAAHLVRDELIQFKQEFPDMLDKALQRQLPNFKLMMKEEIKPIEADVSTLKSDKKALVWIAATFTGIFSMLWTAVKEFRVK